MPTPRGRFQGWNKWEFFLVAVLVGGCGIHAPPSSGICPNQPGASLRFLDVFDGPPEELASLVPEEVTETSGYWQLGYVYDSGRTVTIRCKYDNGQEKDVLLSNKVEKCDYTIDVKGILQLGCK